METVISVLSTIRNDKWIISHNTVKKEFCVNFLTTCLYFKMLWQVGKGRILWHNSCCHVEHLSMYDIYLCPSTSAVARTVLEFKNKICFCEIYNLLTECYRDVEQTIYILTIWKIHEHFTVLKLKLITWNSHVYLLVLLFRNIPILCPVRLYHLSRNPTSYVNLYSC